MDNFFIEVGTLALIFAAVYVTNRLFRHLLYRKTGFHENNKVYKAAVEFRNGASNDEIRQTLGDCFEFNSEDINTILSRSAPHKKDSDGGYAAFLRAVNEVIGADIYSSNCQV